MKKDYERILQKVLEMMSIRDYSTRCRKADFVIVRILVINALLHKGYMAKDLAKLL